ncbi:manganese and iron superoxide dismutase [Atractiella rhizophila]|nr:manganese and iron superoxide dismutase [Atractiella rhizophila]
MSKVPLRFSAAPVQEPKHKLPSSPNRHSKPAHLSHACRPQRQRHQQRAQRLPRRSTRKGRVRAGSRGRSGRNGPSRERWNRCGEMGRKKDLKDLREGFRRRLKEVTTGTPHANKDIFNTILSSTSTEPSLRSPQALHYASLLLNNSYMLSSLSSTPTPFPSRSDNPTPLANCIYDSFRTYEGLKTYFSSAAMGVEGEGFLWLVLQESKEKSLNAEKSINAGVVLTAGTGTMLVQGGEKRGAWNGVWGVEDAKNLPPLNKSRSSSPQDRVGRFTVSSQEPWTAIHPLFCLSLYEHCWLKDYGILGKKEYVENFWKVLDWDKLEERFERILEAEREKTEQKRAARRERSLFSRA